MSHRPWILSRFADPSVGKRPRGLARAVVASLVLVGVLAIADLFPAAGLSRAGWPESRRAVA
jgi:hypothetical protein